MASALSLQWSTCFYNPPVSLKDETVDASAMTITHQTHNQLRRREEVSVAVAFFYYFFLLHEICRDCESGGLESCLEQTCRFPLLLCGLCKPLVSFAEDRNSIDLLLRVSGCNL